MDQINQAAAYVPPNVQFMVNEWEEGTETGEPSRIDALNEVFAWKRGFQSGWYGWANDGKGTFFDFAAVMKSKIDKWKWCFFKQEDMSSRVSGDKKTRLITMTADDIYNNLIWALTGKTPYKHFAKKHFVKQIPLAEYIEAIEWVEKHFFVIYPRDRKYKAVMDDFMFYYDKYGIDGFLIDPFKSLILPEGSRTDFMMNELFIECKEFALKTNSSMNFIAHPKSMMDVKEKDGRYKVVNQFMIAGGAAWDNNMDAQYSIYRPERHLSPSDPKVNFINLKQRKAEIVGAKRGEYTDIRFDFMTKRYFFNGICPIDGSMSKDRPGVKLPNEPLFEPPPFVKNDNDKVPF